MAPIPLAFTPALSLTASRSTALSATTLRPVHFSRRRAPLSPTHRPAWVVAQQRPEKDAVPQPDDEALQQELREKVNELFGGRQNVSIDFDAETDRAKFSVRRDRAGVVGRGASVAEAEEDSERNAARTVISSIAVLSLITGIVFTVLYYSGAVHGSSSADMSRYEMPTYGTNSYVDPYKLLEQDRQASDSQVGQ